MFRTFIPCFISVNRLRGFFRILTYTICIINIGTEPTIHEGVCALYLDFQDIVIKNDKKTVHILTGKKHWHNNYEYFHKLPQFLGNFCAEFRFENHTKMIEMLKFR